MLSARAAWLEGFWAKAGDGCTNTPITSPSPTNVFATLSAEKIRCYEGRWSSRRVRCIV